MRQSLSQRYECSDNKLSIVLIVTRAPVRRDDKKAEILLQFKKFKSDKKFDGTYPGIRELRAAAQQAGIARIDFVKNYSEVGSIYCTVPEDTDHMTLGCFLVYLSQYTHQMQV